MGITIRHATIEDAPVIAEVNIVSWQTTYRGLINDSTLDGMTFETYLEKWLGILSTAGENNNFCFVAENESGEIIGYTNSGNNSHPSFGFEAELYAIYLLKAYQGKGIGKQLFIRTIDEFKSRNISSFLLFVLSNNIPSRRFYESLKPDFSSEAMITIDNNTYCDHCYGWSNINATCL